MPNSPKKIHQPIPAETERIGKIVLEMGEILAETEVKLPIVFEGVQLESGLRIDMLVEKSVSAELKSVEKMNPV